MLKATLPGFWSMLIWGLMATTVMTTVLQGAQGLGFSRPSVPFLVGTFFTDDRRWAVIVGFAVYIFGGWVIAFLYFLLFASAGLFTWWSGIIVGTFTASSCSFAGCRCSLTHTRGWRRNMKERQ